MSRLRWSEENTIYIPEVDAEHRSLYLLAADLKRALANGAGAEEIDGKVRALLAEVEDHFTHEERLMRAAKYAMIDWHKGLHDTLRKRATLYAGRIHAGDRKAGRELIDFASRWLEDHMAVADKMMGAALRNHRRSRAA
ncbi:MAG: hemerythrin family protein [Candidatus Sulfopaludibacter sp.]|nr:hemerythrin family protein [Candidatus Sulfopaludibacter sp.]